MKKAARSIISIFMIIIFVFCLSMSALADEAITDMNGQRYLVFGGHMVDQFGDKHTLDNVECYIDFVASSNFPLWTAINDAIDDWNWHLGYISKTMSAQDGYSGDYYNFGMAHGNVTKAQADIRFEYTNDYINKYNEIMTSTYAFCEPYNAVGQSVLVDVATNRENWRYSVITFSQRMFNEYNISHTDSETAALMKRTANHEIGHALGLAHDTRDTGIIMYGSSSHALCTGYLYDIDNMTATVPTLHDLMAVYLLYA